MDRMDISFFVPGQPKPGGSKTPTYNTKTGKMGCRPANPGTKGWRELVKFFAVDAMNRARLSPPQTGAVHLIITFVMPRPKAHFTSKGELRHDAPYYHTNAPDTTKLVRSTEDSLKGVCWRDDCMVAKQSPCKIYGIRPGAHIRVVWPLETPKLKTSTE